MSDKPPFEDTQIRFKELASGYQPKLPPKLAQMLPHKKQIQELRERKAAYDDIRLLLAEDEQGLSCRLIRSFDFAATCLAKNQSVPTKPARPKHPSSKVSPVLPSPESIQATLGEQRERFPGPWSRRKRGPRIANSKNL